MFTYLIFLFLNSTMLAQGYKIRSCSSCTRFCWQKIQVKLFKIWVNAVNSCSYFLLLIERTKACLCLQLNVNRHNVDHHNFESTKLSQFVSNTFANVSLSQAIDEIVRIPSLAHLLLIFVLSRNLDSVNIQSKYKARNSLRIVKESQDPDPLLKLKLYMRNYRFLIPRKYRTWDIWALILDFLYFGTKI